MNRFLGSLCLIALHMGSKSVGASPEDGGYVFNPEEIVTYEMPLSCLDQNFCFDKDDKYPQTTIDRLLEQMPVPMAMSPEIAKSSGITTSFSFREGDEVPDDSDCPANTTYIGKPIYYIVDEKNQLRVVVQSPKFQQIYSVKWCQHPGQITERTAHFTKETTKHYKIECLDTLMNLDFFVLKDNDGLEMDFARPKGGIPVHCRCRYSEV